MNEAREEAERRWPKGWNVELGTWRDGAVNGFVLGAEWQASQQSDEHHTMDELYDYRMVYNAHAAQDWLDAGISVVKSWRHSDGEPCFGGGWFIVVADLPSGQVSNHYKAEHWGLFDVPEVETPPAYDGHTPLIALDRLKCALAYPRQSETRITDEMIDAVQYIVYDEYREGDRDVIRRALVAALDASSANSQDLSH